ncbi:MAG: hypothetical protein C0424_03600 [Sphingobacteriaceae bacterium]|nr:hypothetical protein [Sphingobacteriaceae bacterium]
MTLVKFNQRNSLPSFVDRFFHTDPFGFPDDYLNREQRFIPAVNIRETEQAWVVELAAPGRKREDFKVEVHHQMLSISSESKHQKEEKEAPGKYSRREFRLEQFKRFFTLPDGVAEEAIKAQYEAGVLQIELPKKEEARPKSPRQIDIF